MKRDTLSQKEILKIFVHFLKDNNAFLQYRYYAYAYCLKYPNSTGGIGKYVEYNITNCPHRLINTAFEWRSTTEGFRFWAELHKKWQNEWQKYNI